MDWLGLAKHFAQHTAMELAKVFDAMESVKRYQETNAYSPGIVALNELGENTVDLKDTTRSIIIQAQNGYLDGLTLQIGNLKFTYPSEQITVDCLHLPTLNERVKLIGTAGDSYIFIETSISDFRLSDALNNSTVVFPTPQDVILTTGSNIVGEFINGQLAGEFTTTALAANGVYTSPQMSIKGYARITGTMYSDQSGTLLVNQSSDGVNYDVDSSIALTASTPTSFSVEIVAPYAELKFTNGATAQTTFRLYSFLRRI